MSRSGSCRFEEDYRSDTTAGNTNNSILPLYIIKINIDFIANALNDVFVSHMQMYNFEHVSRAHEQFKKVARSLCAHVFVGIGAGTQRHRALQSLLFLFAIIDSAEQT